MGTGGKHRWKISFHRSPSLLKKQPPTEFICPISGSLMADPVIVTSGQTFDRNCVLACNSIGFTPLLSDASTPDFSDLIPNMALKSLILNWCDTFLVDRPKPVDFRSAEELARSLMASQKPNHRVAEQATLPVDGFIQQSQLASSSEESVIPTTPLPLPTRPSCCSSSSSSDVETLSPNSAEEETIVARLRSSLVFEQEEAVASLRKTTRTREDTRIDLCTSKVLSALRSLIVSRYAAVQVNAVAALVNLSLENKNKVKIVRSGIVPPLIDVLRAGFPEAQEHAAGALFSLAIHHENKTAIGVLGALEPLLHALRSDSERARNDSALALYHLSLVQSNRSKLLKLGSVQTLLGMASSGHMRGRAMLVLCSLAACAEGRGAMLDAGAVKFLVGMLAGDELDTESTRESCVAALYLLSRGGLRFKGLAKEAGAEEALLKVEKMGSGRAREKVRRMLELMEERDQEEEAVDWEELLNSEEVTREPCKLDHESGAKS